MAGLLTGGELQVKIISVTGKVCTQLSVAENEEIDINSLPSGIYLVTIQDELGLNISKQLVKSH